MTIWQKDNVTIFPHHPLTFDGFFIVIFKQGVNPY